MKITDINAEKIYRLSGQARTGNIDALKQLQRINAQIVNNIKRREKNIHKEVQTTPALERLKASLEGPLSKSNRLPIDQYRNQSLAGIKFLNAKTGTVRGYKKYQSEEISRLRERGIDITEEEFAGIWRDFISSQLAQEVKQFGSERMMEGLKEAIKNNRTLEDFTKAWNRYKSGKTLLLDAWDEAVNGNI